MRSASSLLCVAFVALIAAACSTQGPSTAGMTTRELDAFGVEVVTSAVPDGGYLPRNISVQRTWAMTQLEALTPLEMSAKLSWNPARMFGLTTKGHLSPGADADVTVVDPATGAAVLSLVAGNPVMRDGQSLGQGGTLLVTSEGEAAARRSGLGFQVVDLSQSKLYQGYS